MTTPPTEADSGIGRRRAQARGQQNAGYAERRQEILDAAADLFKRQGYRGTSLVHVATAVGADRATLYYYFSSKQEIFDALVTGVVRQNLEVAEQICRDTATPAPDRIRDLVVGLMQSYADHYPLLFVYLQENMAHVDRSRQAWAQEMREVNRRYEAAVTSIIEQGVAEGTLRAVTEPWVLAYGVMGIVSWSHRWYNPSTSAVDAATIGTAYADVLIRGMQADASGAPGG